MSISQNLLRQSSREYPSSLIGLYSHLSAISLPPLERLYSLGILPRGGFREAQLLSVFPPSTGSALCLVSCKWMITSLFPCLSNSRVESKETEHFSWSSRLRPLPSAVRSSEFVLNISENLDEANFGTWAPTTFLHWLGWWFECQQLQESKSRSDLDQSISNKNSAIKTVSILSELWR